MTGKESPVDHRVMDAIRRAIVRSTPTDQPWTVCVRTPDNEELISLRLGCFNDVEQLAGEIRGLGYRIKLMHPEHTHCDFILEPQ